MACEQGYQLKKIRASAISLGSTLFYACILQLSGVRSSIYDNQVAYC